MTDRPLSAVRRVDEARARFEAAWGGGSPPRIDDYLAGSPADDRPALLRELVPIDVFHRRRRGEEPRADEYHSRYPELDPVWLADAVRPAGPSVADATPRLAVAPVLPVGGEATPGPGRPDGTAVTPRSPLLRTSQPLPPPVPGYEFLGVLGRGGMGIVHKARHVQLDRVVAVKMVSGSDLTNPDVVRRFCREMRAAARLSHPNIVTVYDAGEAGGAPYFTMECLEGADLWAVVRRRGPLPVAEACEYVRQAALGLQHALDRGLIHRDVKPANLFVTTDGIVKVLDLGLARLIGPHPVPAATGETTWEGVLIGTPDFVAPEQLRDPTAADTRADLYSLGATFYYLLTGQPPFPDGSVAVKIARHLSDDAPRPVESLRPDCPPAVVAVVRKLLAKRREDRYQTPAELAAALAAPGPADRAVRRRVAIGSVAVLLAAGLGVVIWRPWYREPDRTDGSAAAPSQPGAPDRRAAEILLPRGFELHVKTEAGEETLKPGDPLPAGRFAVVRLSIEPVGGMLKNDFVRETFLPAAAELSELTSVADTGGRMTWTADDLTRLARAPAGQSLESLLSRVELTPDTLKALKDFPRLRSLQLRAADADDAVLERLKELPGLTYLRLDVLGSSGAVTDRGRAVVTALSVRRFALYRPAGFDRRFAELVAGMPELDDFFLWTDAPLDDVVELLARAPKLRALGMNDTLTDAGLEKLRAAKQLRYVRVRDNKGVSGAGVKALAAALPECEIDSDHGTFGPKD